MNELLIRRRGMGKPPVVPFKNQYLTFEALEEGTFQFTNAVDYSINKGAWTTLAAATDTPTLEAGDIIRWRATLTPNSTNGIGTFSSTGEYNAYGNPLSLRSGDSFRGVTVLPNNTYMFYKLFYQSTLLISAENIALPFTTLRNYCYRSMFGGCTGLVAAPALPARTMVSYCYYGMFANCSSLTVAPEMSTTTLAYYGFAYMFQNSGLIGAPPLPATTLAEGCYYGMFDGCTSMTTPMAELPATTAMKACYRSMFSGCSSLIEMPIIRATTGAVQCFYGMFNGCRSLTITHDIPTIYTSSHMTACYAMFYSCTSMENAPALLSPVIADESYRLMFYGCSKLKYIKCLLTSNPGSKALDWVVGVSLSGTFVKHPDMTEWTIGTRWGIPSGWTVEDAVLE